MEYYVYILFSPLGNKYYVGHTEDIEKRIAEHTIRKNLGWNDWELKYSEKHATRAKAMAREREIKAKKKRSYLEYLIGRHK